jgi:hypothetical protein
MRFPVLLTNWFAVAVTIAVSFVLISLASVVNPMEHAARPTVTVFDVATVVAGGGVEVELPTYATNSRSAFAQVTLSVHVEPEAQMAYRDAPEKIMMR